MPPKKISLKYQLYNAVKVNPDKFTTKLTEAPTIQKKDYGKFQIFKTFGVVQADVIYMAEDEKTGNKYIVTVLDVATRKMDMEAMQGRTANHVIEAFQTIFKRKYISEDIETLYTDPGVEFKNKHFKEYIESLGIDLRFAMTARKQQMQPIEGLNNIVTKVLGTKMTTEELDTEGVYNNWTQFLPEIVKVLNAKENLKTPSIKGIFGEPKATAKEIENILKIGEVVHVRLQAPKDHLPDENGNYQKLWGYNFRNGDIRWEKEPTRISRVIIVPNQPIRYMVEKYNNVSFIRKEILVTDEARRTAHNTNNPPKPEPKAPEKIDLSNHVGPITRSMKTRAI